MAARRKVLVCGATGFIGRNIAEALAERGDLEVVGTHHARAPFDHPGLAWIEADLTRPEDAERCAQGVDVIIQAAATTSGAQDIVTRPYIHVTDNAVMNSHLFRAAHDHGVGHVVFFSCSVMYPTSDVALPESAFDANAGIHPRYFGVGWTKVYIEKLCEFYARLGRTRYTAIRHSNIYGPHDKFDFEHSHVLGATVTKTMTATDGKVTVWGTGEEGRDLLYVDDLTDFVARAIEDQATPFELYNVGAGSAVTIRSLIERVIAASGRDLAVAYDASRPTIKTSLFLDCAKARRELGWQPRVPLDDGIARTIAWWKANVRGDGVTGAAAAGA